MSNAGQAVLTVVGAVVGFVATGGNPVGAMYGAQLGLLAGSRLFPTQLPHVHGPRMEDLETTSAQLGTPIPYIYGTIAVAGTPMYLGCAREVATTEELGGKGGGTEQESTTYTYYQTIALALNDGEITGLYRVWENGELKYDVRPQQDGETGEAYSARLEASSSYGAGFSLYLGTETQLPDPTMETEVGVGYVQGFRGLAYIVYPDRQLLDTQGRRHPVFRFEIYKSGTQGNDVEYPINLTADADGWQKDVLVPDWAHNRYFTVDYTGDDYLRAYSIEPNEEYAQAAFNDILPAPILVPLTPTVGIDGYLYYPYFSAGNTVTLTKIDPLTLETIQWGTFAGVSLSSQMAWGTAIPIRQHGVTGNRDYVVGAALGVDTVTAIDCSTLSIATALAVDESSSLVCQGEVDGVTSYAYVLGWEATLSGSGPGITIYRITFTEHLALSGEYLPDVTTETFATIAPEDFDPTWTRLVRVEGLVFDEADDCLIFGLTGDDATGVGAGQERYVKWNPATGEIEWQTPPGDIPLANYDANHNLSRLRGSTYAASSGTDDFFMIDTRTGSYTVYSDWYANFGLDPQGEHIYDSARNAVVTFAVGEGPTVVYFDRRVAGPVSLAEIVRDVWDRCGGDEEDIDVTDLEERFVNGYATARPMPGRGAVEGVRALGPFDCVESEGILKFPVRGKPIVATLTTADVGVTDGEASSQAPAIRRIEKQDIEQPRRIRLKYISTSRDYEPGEQLSSTRFTSSTVNELDVELAVAIDDDVAAQTADILWAEAWQSRWSFETSVDIKWLSLDPADCIGIPFDGRVLRARIVDVDDSGGGLVRKLQLLRDDDGTYVSEAIATPPARPNTTVVIYSTTAMILLDLPPLVDTDDNAGFYAAVYPSDPARAWTGAVINRSSDGGVVYGAIGAISNAATVGRLLEDLPAGITTSWDDENEIVLEMLSGEPSSTTDAALLENSANAIAVGAHGRWEIVQFGVATQETATRWRLSHLLRGRRATEHNTGTGEEGDFAVFLTTGVGRIPMQISDIGVEKIYRAVTINTTFATGTEQSFTGEGEALKPFSPVNITGVRDDDDDMIIDWTRRGRIGYEMPSGADIPLSEETEEYEIEIAALGDPDVVLRTLTATTSTVTYTAAQQSADGIGAEEAIYVRIYQISAIVGRGHYGEAALPYGELPVDEEETESDTGEGGGSIAGDLLFDGFESGDKTAPDGPPPAFNEDDFEWTSAHAWVTVQPSVGYDGGYGLRFRFAPHGEDVAIAEQRFAFGSAHPKLCVSFRLRVPDNYVHNSRNNKLFAVWMDDYSFHGEGPTVVWETWPNGSGGSTVAVHWSEGNFNIAGPHMFDDTPFIEVPDDRGQWMQIVMYVEAATTRIVDTDPDTYNPSDGIIRMWRRWSDDDPFELLHEVENANIAPPPSGPDGWQFGYFIGAANMAFAEEMDFVIDDVQFGTIPLI